MAEVKLDELNRYYSRGEEVDRAIFAEMRSNVLLVAGEHYSLYQRTNERMRTTRSEVSKPEQKLRLTKNHMHRLRRTYVKAILASSPSTAIRPAHETDIHDQKDAELNHAVWQYVRKKHKISEKTRDWVSDFATLGEVCVKVFWDHMAGAFVGYEPKIDELGQPVMQETGNMVQGVDPATGFPVLVPELVPVDDETKPIFTGDFVFERIYGFNLLRDPSVQDMNESRGRPWIVRKMMDTNELKKKYPDEAKKISDSGNDTYVVFDANRGSYEKTKGQTLVKEFFWEPCLQYPQGYYAIATSTVILAQGPLPEGIFPLVWKPFEKNQTSPRGRSILKVARPYQAEINRASSKIAEAQVVLGDDKLVYSQGAKITQGALLPGVRGIAVSGPAPTILPGRDGSQYQPYVKDQIAEMDLATQLQEVAVTGQNGQLDAYALLYKSFARKEIYQEYIEGFEEFLIAVTELTLKLARYYMPDDAVVPAVGLREAVNIPEFRNTSPLSHKVIVEASQDTLETMFGKQLTLTHVLQYVGADLDQATKAKLIKGLPFANSVDAFDDFLIDDDIAKNDFLALDRGEQVQAVPFIEPTFMIRKISSREKKPEFKFLDPQIQQNYAMLRMQYEQIEAENQQRIIAAKNEYIPVDGALVTCDIYVNDPNNPEGESKRARLPQRAIEWLIQQLETQGASLEKLESMNSTALSEMATMILGNRAPTAPQVRG